MLTADEKAKLEHGFAEAEASLLLEGMRPSPFGFSLKQRLMSGEISVDQAESELRAHYSPAVSKIA